MTSPLRLFQGLLAGISRRTQTRRRHRQRRLLLESLEQRSLLATNLGAIAGTVYLDKTDNGFTADDVGRPSVTVNLYLDSNATGIPGVLDGGDAQVATQLTDASGKYRFEGLSAGTYFVKQLPVLGLYQQPGQNVQTVPISATDAQGTACLLYTSPSPRD